jgi:CheY-like chemotaxis protein/HAMP domain-containing protein
MTAAGEILVVEDNPVNRKLLVATLSAQGYSVTPAVNGREALEKLRNGRARRFDVVLLDIVMPEMDGYDTLRAIRADRSLQDLPVLMISAVDEIESVIECVKMGATDYLAKPFNADLLRARIESSLTAKRLRDLELEYLDQVRKLTDAASAVEVGTFQTSILDDVAGRHDELGRLARVFQRMAREVRAREERLIEEVRELRIEIDEARQNRQVAEITESDFYRRLTSEAEILRRIVSDPES